MVLHWSKSQEFTNNFNSSLKSAMEFMLQRSKPAINLARRCIKDGFQLRASPFEARLRLQAFQRRVFFFVFFFPFYPAAELMINMLYNTRI